MRRQNHNAKRDGTRAYIKTLREAEYRTAYSNGYAAGLLGAAINPHPRGSVAYRQWASGYRAGRGR